MNILNNTKFVKGKMYKLARVFEREAVCTDQVFSGSVLRLWTWGENGDLRVE